MFSILHLAAVSCISPLTSERLRDKRTAEPTPRPKVKLFAPRRGSRLGRGDISPSN